ncbi:unnamed protein product [Owenia fusiformis]|uniref:Uncharacterized protein n=1 Tax=Owenia fusiformis TaxID=6347 RepID=A0A8J1XSC0_OWEFU|nr:unnamed protein product [Owenia fusiformis]
MANKGGEEAEPEELIGEKPPERNWKGIGLAALVILLVLSLVVVAVFLVYPRTESVDLGEAFTFEDASDPQYKPRSFQAQWVGDKNQYFYLNSDGALVVRDLDTNKTIEIMSNQTFKQQDTELFWLSEDLQYVLLATSVEKIWRHSFTAHYKVYNVATKKSTSFPKDGDRLQYAGWSTSGHKLSYVMGNNLYTANDPDLTPNKVTSNGEDSLIYNGIADWVYEEEVLSASKAHWWSPDSSKLAFAMFNDTNVKTYSMPWYGTDTGSYGSRRDVYGMTIDIKYPKAGDTTVENNPTFQLYVNSGGNNVKLKPPQDFVDGQYYFTTIVWKDNNHLLVNWLNRAQNHSIITLCSASQGNCILNLDLKADGTDGTGWIDIYEAPVFLPSGTHYFMRLPQREGVSGFWRHIAKIETTLPSNSSSDEMTGVSTHKDFITMGEEVVTSILAYNDNLKELYYISTGGDSRKRHLYSVNTETKAKHCMSCNISNDCLYVTASFSHSAKHYVLGCLGPGIPFYHLKSTESDSIEVVEDNEDVKESLSKKALPKLEYHEIDVGGYKTWIQVYLPKKLKKDEIIKYPLLVNVYGGPNSQKVNYLYRIDWSTYLTSSLGYIYASIDGRGSGYKGDKFLHEIYRQLGTKEIEDQLTGGAFLKELHYVDEARTAIWGWSYGGFVTTHVLGAADPVFKCGIAVAPVTDWSYYDTIYTERYMQRPFHTDGGNYKGYDESKVMAKAENFQNNSLLLIHGTADDNVHFQNSAQLMKALTHHGVMYSTQLRVDEGSHIVGSDIYTDKNHAISGETTTPHLYHTMTDYLKNECFWTPPPPEE